MESLAEFSSTFHRAWNDRDQKTLAQSCFYIKKTPFPWINRVLQFS